MKIKLYRQTFKGKYRERGKKPYGKKLSARNSQEIANQQVANGKNYAENLMLFNDQESFYESLLCQNF